MTDIIAQAEVAAAHGERRSRDGDALDFLQALDDGDLATLAVLYERAAHDPQLTRILDGVFEQYIQEGGSQ